MKFVLSLIASAALFSTEAGAFIFLSGGGFTKGERPVSSAPVWTGRVVRFYVNTNISALGGSSGTTVTGAELFAAAEAAAAAWSAACRADLRIVVVGTTSNSYNTSDGVNTILWDNRTAAEGNYYNPDSATVSASATNVTSGTEFLDCDIVMNGATTTALAYSPTVADVDLRSVLTHEIGHCLGLDHPIESAVAPSPGYSSANTYLTDATMVQTNALPSGQSSDTTRRDINQDDRDGIECIYERGRPFRTGARCTSYHGTNGGGTIVGQGAITGGPSADDTVCGSDAQGRNARPSEEAGDGCIASSFASNSPPNPRSATEVLFQSLFSSWGFVLAFLGIFTLRRFYRRSLRRRAPALSLWLAAGMVFVSAWTPLSARAWELEASLSGKKVDPGLWKDFSAMDPTVTTWDRYPSAVDYSAQTEFGMTAFHSFSKWGKWGGYLTLTLPNTITTNAKAQSAAEQSKETSIWGFRLGPSVRWYPRPGSESKFRWYVGGKLGLGAFMGNQSFASTTSGSVSYRSYASELALTTGVEFPVGPLKLVVEGGYSRVRSSYFTSSGNNGAAYTDFPAGTRLAVVNSAGTQDLKFDASGFMAAVGVQMTLGKTAADKAERAFDDYEGSTPAAEPTPAATPVPEPKTDTSRDEATPAPIEPKSTAPTPPLTPAPSPAPLPPAPPLEDPMESQRAFEEENRARPAPRPVPVEPPFVPRKREPWEIDAPPEVGGRSAPPVIPGPDGIPWDTQPSPPNEPDPVPLSAPL
jgi:hypothetical protein